jgi:hypothetical protein
MSDTKDKLKALIDKMDDKVIEGVLADLQPKSIDKVKAASDFLFSVCNGMTLNMTGEKEITYYNSKGEWILQQNYKNEKLYVSYWRVWELLKPYLGDNYDVISDFIRDWMEINLNWRGLTPLKVNIHFHHRRWRLTSTGGV